MVQLIPKYGKWEPALVSFYLLFFFRDCRIIDASHECIKCRGEYPHDLKVYGWLDGQYLGTHRHSLTVFGFNGVALALLVVSGSLYLVIRVTRRVADFSFISNVKGPVAAAGIQGGVYAVLLTMVPAHVSVAFCGWRRGRYTVWRSSVLMESGRINAFVATIRRSIR